MKKAVWTKTKSTSIPVDIIQPKEDLIQAVVEFPKRFPTQFHPAELTIKELKTKLNDGDVYLAERAEINCQKEVLEKLIEIESENFPGSKFTVTVPFHFATRESIYQFFTLEKKEGRGKLTLLDGQLTADEWVLDRNGVNLTTKQLIKYQTILNDNRKKNKPSEQEIY
ncbi:MAG: hypothetical protein KBC84_08175 [Proteobacteria bacterium]|nr:hypothetical protein [Pseudomonadota bacterium]